jgi:hypothetical protein
MLILTLVATACSGNGKNAAPSPPPSSAPSASQSAPVTTAPADSCTPAGPAQAADTTPPPVLSRNGVVVGLSPGDNFAANEPGAQERIDAQMSDAQKLGSAAVRLDIKWSDVQPSCGSPYDWSAVKLLVDQAVAHHQWVQAIFDSPPSWAIASDCGHSDEPWKCAVGKQYTASFAAFVRTGVAMFGTQILAVEILNEPNMLDGYYQAAGDYAELLRAAFYAVRTVNHSIDIEPGGTGDVGTTNPDEGTNPTEWYQQLKDAGIAPFITRVNLHPYTLPSSTVDPVYNRGWLEINSTHELFPTLPLDVTEIGWFTSPHGDNHDKPKWADNQPVTERAQAVLIASMFGAFGVLRSHGIASRVFVFSLRDSNDGTFGIERRDGTPKKSAPVFMNAAKQYNH